MGNHTFQQGFLAKWGAIWSYITDIAPNHLPAFRQNLLNFQSITG